MMLYFPVYEHISHHLDILKYLSIKFYNFCHKDFFVLFWLLGNFALVAKDYFKITFSFWCRDIGMQLILNINFILTYLTKLFVNSNNWSAVAFGFSL